MFCLAFGGNAKDNNKSATGWYITAGIAEALKILSYVVLLKCDKASAPYYIFLGILNIVITMLVIWYSLFGFEDEDES